MRVDFMVPSPPDADPGALHVRAFLQDAGRGKSTVIRDGNKTVTIATDGHGRTVVTKSTDGVPPIPGVPEPPAFPGSRELPFRRIDFEMMSRRAEHIAYGFFTMCAIIVVGWPLARAFGRRIEKRGTVAPLHPAASEQLQRIEQGMEAMAIEIERISESQRFLAKLQSGSSVQRV